MNLKTPLLTSAALLLAMTALAAPAQAVEISGVPTPVVRNPCDNMASPDPELQAIIQACRNADNNLVGAVGQVILLATQKVNEVVDSLPGADPDNLLPDVCSQQENVVPYALECAAWAIIVVSELVPNSEQIVALLNSVIAQVTALAQWAQDYVLVDLFGWYDATSGQAAADIGNEGTWVLSQTGYSTAVGTWANGVAGQAVVDAGREVAYAGATAGTAAADANALAVYVNCRLFSVESCGPVPTVHPPGAPPVPVTPSSPPTPSNPPAPTAPSPPPGPSDPPIGG